MVLLSVSSPPCAASLLCIPMWVSHVINQSIINHNGAGVIQAGVLKHKWYEVVELSDSNIHLAGI